MKTLHAEMLRRFPEIRSMLSEGDEMLPYVLMHCLADWLRDLGDAVPPSIVERVVAFTRWCESQPPGEDAGNDLFTVVAVGFYEHLFDCASTRRLLPRLITYDDMIRNADYLRQWVGADNYARALQEYERKD